MKDMTLNNLFSIKAKIIFMESVSGERPDQQIGPHDSHILFHKGNF